MVPVSDTFERVLSLETSTPVGGVALVVGDRVVSSVVATMAGSHSRRLLVDAHRILADEGLTVQDLDLIVVSQGPGSFTGLRIGMATAKGLHLASGVPLVGVSSLATMASGAACGLVAPALDARKREVYLALYDAETLAPLVPDSVVSPRDAVGLVADAAGGRPVAWMGGGARLYWDVLGGSAPGWRLLGPAWEHPDPIRLALLGRERASTEGLPDPAALEPNYIRPSEAELARAKRPTPRT